MRGSVSRRFAMGIDLTIRSVPCIYATLCMSHYLHIRRHIHLDALPVFNQLGGISTPTTGGNYSHWHSF